MVSPSEVLIMAIKLSIFFFWVKGKMTNVMLEILHVFFLWHEFWCTGIPSPHVCKWLWSLNWSKWILVVHIPTQFLFTIFFFSMITLQGVNWEFTFNSHQSETIYDNAIFFAKLKAIEVNRVSKIWLRMSATTNIHLLQLKSTGS